VYGASPISSRFVTLFSLFSSSFHRGDMVSLNRLPPPRSQSSTTILRILALSFCIFSPLTSKTVLSDQVYRSNYSNPCFFAVSYYRRSQQLTLYATNLAISSESLPNSSRTSSLSLHPTQSSFFPLRTLAYPPFLRNKIHFSDSFLGNDNKSC